jgi:Zn-dependent peptidase ImmA (M78 family)
MTVSLNSPEFRKLTKFPAKDVDRIVQYTKDYLERYLELESLVCVLGEFKNPLEDLPEINGLDDIENATRSLRKAWKLDDKPIYNLVGLLEDLHIKVVPLAAEEDFDGMQAIVNNTIPVIAYNTRKIRKPDRIRFTILHELAHLILKVNHHTFHRKEQLCNQFAASMLLPKTSLVAETGSVRQKLMIEELGQIKEQFGISIQAALFRLKDLSIINDHYFKQFYFYINQMNWRVDEPFDYTGLEKSSRFDQLLFRALAEGVMDENKAAELKNVSLQEFRRERLSIYSPN